jgi:hypothetical protein
MSSADKKEELKFCLNPNCNTRLRPRTQPNYWLFQFNPKIYRWFDRNIDTNDPEQWLTSQHSKNIKERDLVAIWASGKKAGIYALGEIITNPTKTPLNLSQQKYYIDKTNIHKFQEKKSVTVKYFNIKMEPLLEDQCRNDPILSEMQVFNNSQGTNFRLKNTQWNRILLAAN